MKKFINGIYILAIIVFVIDWGVLGLKIFDGEYEIITEVYIGLVCWIVMILSLLYRKFTMDKCQYCGKLRTTNGKYCSYCGKEINK